ncbi:MAG: hypothetical protein DMF77_17960, partial [Acidobacteria bacterium]
PSATATDFTSPYSATLRLSNGPGDYLIQAIAFRECRRESVTTPQIRITAGCFAAREVAGMAWSSDLAVDGGRLQVVINGAAASFPGAGRSIGTARLTGKPNRVEATLVDAAGKPGSWRFDLMGSPAAVAGSIRVIAGEVVEIAGTSVTFRLAGKPGERVVFEFLSQ